MLFVLLLCSCLNSNTQYLEKYPNTFFEIATFGKPQKVGTWASPPVVKACEGVKISETRVMMALSFWENSGYDFEDVIFDYNSMECVVDNYGTGIVITTADQSVEEKYLAFTKTSVNKRTGYITRAKILIKETDITRERILEHEIGHALGWKHYLQKLHMMHPEWKYGGYDNKGMRKTD
tara:strand:- start:3167 stop:3703 length:537 start_codon:yes stop_codon:yes gene_type:complete